MQDHILVAVSPFYNGHGWTDHGTGIVFKPTNGLRAFRIDLRDNQDLRGIRNSIRRNHLLLLEGELPEMGEPRPEDANPAELTHKEYITLLEGLRSDGDSSELVSELENVKTDLTNANGRITKLETDLGTANSQVAQLNSELQSTKTELENTEAQLTSANGENTRLESELGTAKTNLQTTEASLATANGEISRLESELQTTDASLTDASGRITQLESDLQDTEADLVAANGQITQLEDQIRTLQDELADALAALEEVSDEGIEGQSLGYTREELENKTVAELQQLAKDENIELTATLKADIIQEILDAQ